MADITSTTPVQQLEHSVSALYAAKNPGRDELCDWLWANHVIVVADNATRLATRFGADRELARAGALLHDIADTKMSCFTPNHGEASLEIARDLMQQAGFNNEDIKIVVNDAIRYHGCHGDEAPASLVGKVLATADALAHLQTDFYIFLVKTMKRDKHMILQKIERDFHKKILFDEVREECRSRYEQLKTQLAQQY